MIWGICAWVERLDVRDVLMLMKPPLYSPPFKTTRIPPSAHRFLSFPCLLRSPTAMARFPLTSAPLPPPPSQRTVTRPDPCPPARGSVMNTTGHRRKQTHRRVRDHSQVDECIELTVGLAWQKCIELGRELIGIAQGYMPLRFSGI